IIGVAKSDAAARPGHRVAVFVALICEIRDEFPIKLLAITISCVYKMASIFARLDFVFCRFGALLTTPPFENRSTPPRICAAGFL
ncbi:hypothetical protein ABTK13_21995, partial [Acinetobacter baumannii]